MSTDITDRIASVAIGIYAESFVPQRQDQYAPRRGTLMHQLWTGKRLTLAHQRAWRHFTNDLHNAHGRSGPVSSGYGESTGSRSPSEFRVPRAGVNVEYRRLEKLFGEMSDEMRPNGVLKLDLIGFHRLGYKDEAQARAAGAATVVALLGRIADFYSAG
jgi:hypothetical protein